jgi:hypothetical protein
MSGVTVSISLTKAQQGALYMQNNKRGERIKELRAGLREIVKLADESGQWAIATKARALLEVPKDPT